MKRQLTITYSWERQDGGQIELDHVPYLEAWAEGSISSQRDEGETSGTLSCELGCIRYVGTWSFTSQSI